MEYQEALSSLISLKTSAEEGDIVNLDTDHLNLAFDWEKSPQGYKYWTNIQEQLLPYT